MRRLAAALVLLATAPAMAQAPAFEGSGQAPIVAGDRVRARARALDDAFRQAIDQAAASLLDPVALAKRQSALKLSIEPKARSYLNGYRVLDEGESAGAFRVHVSAEVALDRLERDLDGGARAESRTSAAPRLGACVADHAAGGGADAHALLARLLETLQSAGAIAFELAPACASVRANPGIAPPDAATLAAALKPAGAAGAAGTAGTDGALLLQYEAAPAGPIRGTALVGAHVRLRLDLVDARGAPAWSSQLDHDGFGAAPATAVETTLAAGLDQDLAPLGEAIARRWPRTMALTVRVDGYDRYGELTALQRTLASLPGVTSVEPRRFDAGAAELAVLGLGDVAPILGVAARPPASPGAPRFAARAIDARTVHVQILPPLPQAPPALDGAPPALSPTLPGAPR